MPLGLIDEKQPGTLSKIAPNHNEKKRAGQGGDGGIFTGHISLPWMPCHQAAAISLHLILIAF
ncbi:MAG: hypothetical protein RR650_08160 [Comamonas sp.]|jgi:hypothetical protein|nr:hypothetical protein [Comamonas sp.]